MRTALLNLGVPSCLGSIFPSSHDYVVWYSVEAGLLIDDPQAMYVWSVHGAGRRMTMLAALFHLEQTDITQQHLSSRQGRVWSGRYPTSCVNAQADLSITRWCSPIVNFSHTMLGSHAPKRRHWLFRGTAVRLNGVRPVSKAAV